ncbi:MAG: peptide deformylase [Defluviitaleaceae bacterium]|nr:peptide deformylase [Defluviitaleaceae bacterium]
MALRALRTIGDEILHKVSKPVVAFDDKLHQLLDDMLETMYHEKGCGLAAVQIGVLRRILVIDTGEEESVPIEFINPEVVSNEGDQEGWEGCLSIPGQTGLVERPMTTVVKATNRHGEAFEMRCEGRLAVIFNHEFDHLNGVLYTEKATEIQENESDDDED